MQKTKYITYLSLNLIFLFQKMSNSDLDYKDLVKIFRECTKEPYSFVNIDATFPACDSLGFRKNILNAILLAPL